MKSTYENLIDALRNIPLYMKIKLECLQEIGAILSTRDDVVWYMLLQSLSGMQNNRGYKMLMLNEEKYRKLGWSTIKAIAESDRRTHITSVLHEATVRYPAKKSIWLMENIDKIDKIGGIDAALKQKRALQGKSKKLFFFCKFSGIDAKYARNIWMDLHDSDFYDSIAIDNRLEKIIKLLGISTKNYSNAERYMLDIAEKARLSGWELDRLLFHFNDYFISAINTKLTAPHGDMNKLKMKDATTEKEESHISSICNRESRRGFVVKRLLELGSLCDIFEINVKELAEQVAGKIDKFKNTIPQNKTAICNIIQNDFKKEKRKEFLHLLNFSVSQEKRNNELFFIFRKIS